MKRQMSLLLFVSAGKGSTLASDHEGSDNFPSLGDGVGRLLNVYFSSRWLFVVNNCS